MGTVGKIKINTILPLALPLRACIISVMIPTTTPLSEPVCYDVVSSFIAQVSYVPDDMEMTVTFHNGSDYTYTDVDRETFDDIRLSASVGKALNEFKGSL